MKNASFIDAVYFLILISIGYFVKKSYPHPHIPVLMNEVLQFFDRPTRTFIDATTGMGGHAEALLSAHPEIEKWYAIDRDQEALVYARVRLAPWQDKITFIHSNYSNLSTIAKELMIQEESIDGILADLGVSSLQMDRSDRGFSFSKEGPLDMRMDQSKDLTAADILANASVDELEKIFRDYGEEPKYRKVAAAIVAARMNQPILTTTDLEKVLSAIFPGRGKLNPLTLVFQGLRIAVNNELEGIHNFLSLAPSLLSEPGRLAVIAFHSLEDRPIKMRFQELARDKSSRYNFYNKHVLKPTFQEIQSNPRCRSARMRGLIADETSKIITKKYDKSAGYEREDFDEECFD